MKFHVLCLSTLFLASIPLAAQSPASDGVFRPGPAAESTAPRKFAFNFDLMQRMAVEDAAPARCPVSMRATQKSDGGLMNARSGDAGPLGQRIHLDVDRGPRAVTAIQITVRGTTARPRVYAAQSQPVRSDAVKSFTLTAEGASANGVAISSDLLLRGFTSVQSINLDAVAYADGSRWTPAAGKACSVEPDPLMLVSSR